MPCICRQERERYVMKKIFRALLLALCAPLSPLVFGASGAKGLPRARDAFVIAHNNSYNNSYFASSRPAGVIMENTQDGWVLDNRGGALRTDVTSPIVPLADVSETEGTALIRTFAEEMREDVVTADFALSAAGNGLYVEFSDALGRPALRAVKREGGWMILLPDGDEGMLSAGAGDGSYVFRVVLDLPNGFARVFINNASCGEYLLLSDNVASFRFATEKAATATLTPGRFQVTANYALYETFEVVPTPTAATSRLYPCYGFETAGDVTVRNGSVVLSGGASFTRSFAATEGAYAFEATFLSDVSGKIAFSLGKADGNAVNVTTQDGKLTVNGVELYTLAKDVWQRLRTAVDPEAGEVTVWLNGRVVGTAPLTGDGKADRLVFTQTQSGAQTKIRGLKVYPLAVHDDYVPEPVTRANLNDYIVGINCCNIWKDGFGWSCLTPFAENEPVLGYYDEGNSETADWEIKYLVEHGVDVQAFCWYLRGSADEPVVDPVHTEHPYAYQYAKYADYMKYCIICEAAGADMPLENFKKHVVPYWFENFFLDDRYLKIDNKPVLLFFSGSTLAASEAFGGAAGLAEALAYLNETARAYGFDGMYITDSHGRVPGADARIAYGWGAHAYRYDYHVEQLEAAAAVEEENGRYLVPTVCVGYNIVAWKHRRSPMMTVADFKKTLLWTRDGYLPAHAPRSGEQKKLVWLSNWNEFGEGTYIMPAGLNGFGYLDAVKDVFASDAPDAENVVPTAAQRERINHLYPQNVSLLSRQFNIFDYGETGPVIGTVNGAAYTSAVSLRGIVKSGGALSATSTSGDPQIFYGSETKPLAGSITDTGTVKRIRVDMKVKKDSLVQFFFAVNGEGLAEARSVRLFADSDERKTYVFDMSVNDAWSGTLDYLRFDPTSAANEAFTVYSLTFEDEKTYEKKDITIDGVSVKSRDVPNDLAADGRVLYAFDPRTAVSFRLNTLMRCDRKAGTLSLEGTRGRSVVFTLGSDRYLANGEERSLGYTLYAKDGLPMLDFTAVAGALGFLCSVTEDGSAALSTPTAQVVEIRDASFGAGILTAQVFFAFPPAPGATAVAAFYDRNGRMTASVSAGFSGTPATENVTFSLPNVSFVTAKVFVFESEASLKPMTPPFEIVFPIPDDADMDTSPLFPKPTPGDSDLDVRPLVGQSEEP